VLTPFYNISTRCQDIIPILHIHFLALDSQNPTYIRGRHRGAQVELALVQSWLSNYKRQHSTRCDSLQVNGIYPLPACLTVIDVDSRCVVEAASDCRYLALSYVWESPQLQSFKETKSKIGPDMDEYVLSVAGILA
jgi:hypothetical protein